MRSFLKIVAVSLAATLALVSCSKKIDKQNKLVGDWNITSVSTKSAVVGSQTVDVYLSFANDGTFVIYQKTSDAQLYYNKYTGTWSLDKGVLSGIYASGKSWSGDYNVTFSEGTLTLASMSTPSEVSVFKKAVIPENVVTGARDAEDHVAD